MQPGRGQVLGRRGMREGLGVAAGIPPPLGVERVVRAARDRSSSRVGRADPELDRRPRGDHEVILVLADDVGPLAAQHAQDAQGDVVGVHLLADRRALAEELARDRLAEQADHGDVADVAVGERRALLELFPFADPQVPRRGADEGARDPVLVAVDELAAGEDQGREAVDARALVEDRVGVLGRQRLDAAAAQADAVPRRGARLDHDVVDPRLGQEHADRRPGPGADLGDRQQRPDPDDDPQRRQRRAQGVASERAQRGGGRPRQEAEVGDETPPGLSARRPGCGRAPRRTPSPGSSADASTPRSSSCTRPSRIRTMRSACEATDAS